MLLESMDRICMGICRCRWDRSILHIELLDNLSKQMNVLPDQIELCLFYYNLYYKFSDTE